MKQWQDKAPADAAQTGGTCRKRRFGLALVAILVMAGCAIWPSSSPAPGYYWQAASGQLDMLSRARPLDEVAAAPDTPPALRQRLKLAMEIRAFASRELGLPDNDSYRSYADLGRSHVVWNVFAAPPLSMTPQQWCLPVAGCVAYLGFFDEKMARDKAEGLRAAGVDVHVGGVPAYSTLGWFQDPLLNTFINWSEPELARLIFHELAHQVAYAPGDSEFNESFAAAVEEAGVRRWLAQPGKEAMLAQFLAQQSRRADFGELVLGARRELMALYAGPGSDAEKLAAKEAVIARLQADYRRVKAERWGGHPGYDKWFAQGVNNASLASVGLYNGLKPGFAALLAGEGESLAPFYERVKRLAKQPLPARRQVLEAALQPVGQVADRR